MADKILNGSDEAAKFVENISGWVDRHGRFFGKDERAARWSGCTHIKCIGCGVEIDKLHVKCSDCYENNRIERYNKKERVEWDGKTPLYSDSYEEYFFDEDSLFDYMEENENALDSMRLVICEPMPVRLLDDEYFLEDQHEDAKLPNDIQVSIRALNELLQAQEPTTWTPGKYAAIVTPTSRLNRTIGAERKP